MKNDPSPFPKIKFNYKNVSHLITLVRFFSAGSFASPLISWWMTIDSMKQAYLSAGSRTRRRCPNTRIGCLRLGSFRLPNSFCTTSHSDSSRFTTSIKLSGRLSREVPKILRRSDLDLGQWLLISLIVSSSSFWRRWIGTTLKLFSITLSLSLALIFSTLSADLRHFSELPVAPVQYSRKHFTKEFRD